MKKSIIRPQATTADLPDDAGRRVLLFILFMLALVTLPAVFA